MKDLRKYIRSILAEEIKWATPPPRKKNLKFDEDLMVLHSPDDPNLFILADAGFMQDHPWGVGRIDLDVFYRQYVYGMLQLTSMVDDPCHGARAVKRGAALDGYGPTLYDAVMEITPEPIINDRDSVSSEAIDMMDFYLTKRGDDVQKQLLDNIYDVEYGPATEQKPYKGKTPDPNDDCSPGNFDRFTGGIKGGSGRRWEDDPLSYAYNKELTPRVKEMLEKGNIFIDNYNVFYWDLRKLGTRLFSEVW